MSVPVLYPVSEAAPVLKCSENYVRARLRCHDWEGVKIAGNWFMTEEQIEAVIKLSTSERIGPEPPSPAGLVRNSRFRRRVQMEATIG